MNGPNHFESLLTILDQSKHGSAQWGNTQGLARAHKGGKWEYIYIHLHIYTHIYMDIFIHIYIYIYGECIYT